MANPTRGGEGRTFKFYKIRFRPASPRTPPWELTTLPMPLSGLWRRYSLLIPHPSSLSMPKASRLGALDIEKRTLELPPKPNFWIRPCARNQTPAVSVVIEAEKLRRQYVETKQDRFVVISYYWTWMGSHRLPSICRGCRYRLITGKDWNGHLRGGLSFRCHRGDTACFAGCLLVVCRVGKRIWFDLIDLISSRIISYKTITTTFSMIAALVYPRLRSTIDFTLRCD